MITEEHESKDSEYTHVLWEVQHFCWVAFDDEASWWGRENVLIATIEAVLVLNRKKNGNIEKQWKN